MRQYLYCLLSLILLSPIEIIASNRLEYWKKFFDNRTGILECFEGIFKVNLSIENNSDKLFSNCTVKNYENDNYDTIIIYRNENDFIVYSCLYDKEIGKLKMNKTIYQNPFLATRYQESVELTFEGNGTRNYPNSDENKKEIVKFKYDQTTQSNNILFTLTSISFKHDEKYNILSKEIWSKIAFGCYPDNKINVAFSGFHLQSIAKRIYPNEKDFPKISGISTGTGVLISKDGIVLTNFHVIKENKLFWHWENNMDTRIEKGKIVTQNVFNWKENTFIDEEYKGFTLCSDSITCRIKDKIYNLRVIYADIKNDWAVLKVDDSLYKTTDFAVIDTSNIQKGSEVYTLGYPISSVYGNDVKYTNGYISSNKQVKKYSVNMGINPGNSGGGLFNKNNGQLIGITASRFNDNIVGFKVEAVSFSIKLNDLVKVLRSNNHLKYYYLFNNFQRSWDNTGRVKKYKNIKNSTIILKDLKYNPTISIDQNSNSTVQIFSE